MNSFRYTVRFTNGVVTSVWAKNSMDARHEAELAAAACSLKVRSVKMASPFDPIY